MAPTTEAPEANETHETHDDSATLDEGSTVESAPKTFKDLV